MIALVAEGLNSAEIGSVYGLSAWSADQWRATVKAKLGASNPPHLVHLAHMNKVLPLEPSVVEALLRRVKRRAPS
ncbi:MAG: hypothetical protein QOH16_3512 [Gaiellaceae bacterium]|nr:hypothetical protein [Gaiellaceae bacterium]